MDKSYWILSGNHLWVHLSICKGDFLFMSIRFDMAAILFLEVLTFSKKEKSVFSALVKKYFIPQKNYETKTFYLIVLHME